MNPLSKDREMELLKTLQGVIDLLRILDQRVDILSERIERLEKEVRG